MFQVAGIRTLNKIQIASKLKFKLLVRTVKYLLYLVRDIVI